MSANTKRKKKKHFSSVLILIIVAMVVLFADSWFRIVTDEYEIKSENIPNAFNGFRIVQISDLHGREFGEQNQRLIRAVEKAKPDIITVTGDLIDADDQGKMAQTVLSAFSGIAPTYFVTGNHEWASGGLSDLWTILNRCGVTELENKYVLLYRNTERIVLAGITDPGGPYDMMTPDEIISDIRKNEGDDYLVILNHRNDRLNLFAELGVNLVLSGHAHGGIVRIPFTDGLYGPGRELFPSYTCGLYSRGSTDMIVSRGFGGPIRLFNNPQITVAVLRSV